RRDSYKSAKNTTLFVHAKMGFALTAARDTAILSAELLLSLLNSKTSGNYVSLRPAETQSCILYK
ncbi:hypothetical protein, partial [Bacillus licheniformis]|uniref:hypothetical protein n=1 Tax=Bacillus licheniformis TaxID=1402 RepID=UPI0030C9209C